MLEMIGSALSAIAREAAAFLVAVALPVVVFGWLAAGCAPRPAADCPVDILGPGWTGPRAECGR